MSSVSPTWDEVAKNRRVDEETLAHTKYMVNNGFKMFHEMSLAETRASYDQYLMSLGPKTFGGTTKEITVPASGNQPEVPLFVYTPTNKASSAPKIVVYIHGGGLIFGSPEGYIRVMHKLASVTGAIVVGFKYRLLPDAGDANAPLDDSNYAVRWIVQNKEAVGGDAGSKVGLVGDSAGGQLTILSSLDVEGVDFQVPVYPVVSATPSQSFTDFANIPVFNTKDMEWVVAIQAPVTGGKVVPRLMPDLRENLEKSPPMLLVTAGLDPLAGSHSKIAETLKQKGVSVTHTIYEGVPHGFFASFDFYPKNAGKLYEEIASFINGF